MWLMGKAITFEKLDNASKCFSHQSVDWFVPVGKLPILFVLLLAVRHKGRAGEYLRCRLSLSILLLVNSVFEMLTWLSCWLMPLLREDLKSFSLSPLEANNLPNVRICVERHRHGCRDGCFDVFVVLSVSEVCLWTLHNKLITVMQRFWEQAAACRARKRERENISSSVKGKTRSLKPF